MKRRRAEIAAGLLIPALVVGLPFLTNYSRANPTIVTTISPPPSGDLTGTTTGSVAGTTGAVASMGASGESADPAAGTLPAKPDSSFWDLYPLGGLLSGGLVAAPPASAGAGVSTTTSTTGGATVAGAASPPNSPPPPPPPSSSSTTTATTSPSVPRPPTGLLLAFDSPSLMASWDPASTNTDGTAFVDFRTYQITLSAVGRSATYEAASPNFTYPMAQNQLDFGTPQPELTVTIAVVAASGTRSAPLADVATNPVPDTAALPPALVAGSTQITVTVPDQGPIADLAGFDIYAATSATGPFQLVGSTVGYNAFVHDSLPPGTTYHYLYKIRDALGQVSPGPSPTATATI